MAFVLVFITNLAYSFVVFNSYAEDSAHCLLEKRFVITCFFPKQIAPHQLFNYSTSSRETLEKGVKSIQS